MLYEISEKAIKLENEGKKIIKFNVGDPDQGTPKEIIEAAYEALKQGKTKYASFLGEKRLRDELAKIHNVSSNNIIITHGSKWGLFALLYIILKDRGNVIIPTPHWTAYELMAKRFGAQIKLLETEIDSEWQINPEKMRKLIDKKTKLLILNNPNNPTSRIITEEIQDEIIEIAEDNGILVLSDETYSDISFVKTKSILDYGDNNIMVKSFSKTFAMTGWRIGYVVAEKELIGKIAKLNQISVSNVPVFIQEAALKALELREKISKDISEQYQRRANLACKILEKTKAQISKPNAPFYLFPKYKGLNSEQFALDLLDEGVAIAPGTAFGPYRECFRISLTAKEEKIKEGLEKICEKLR